MYKDCNNTWSSQRPTDKSCKHDSCDENNEKENIITINNNVTINQTNNLEGGDGGNGGDAAGGSAAAANGVVAIAASSTETEIEIPDRDLLNEDEENEESLSPLQAEEGLTATGGAASGGNGGTGGNATNATNSATVTIENVVMITPTATAGTTFKLNNNDRNIDINVDENGDTFVNGQKMDEIALNDGTKVLIFRSNSSQEEKS